MEFRQLRYFVAVADERNFGRAALRLNVSQPPISRQIQALEHELGTRLFVRTPHGVELTESGKVFYRDAQSILANAKNAMDRTRAADRGELGRLDVGFFGSTIYRTVPMALRALKKTNPQIEVSLTRMNKSEQVNAIRDGRIHIGFGRYYSETPDIEVLHIMEEPLLAAVPSDHPMSRQASVRLEDLAKLPVVLFPAGDRPNLADEIITNFQNAGLDIEVDAITGDSASAMTLVACGGRCTLVPESMAFLRLPTLRYLPVSDRTTRIGTSCIFTGGEQAPVLKVFLKAVRQLREEEWFIPETHEDDQRKSIGV